MGCSFKEPLRAFLGDMLGMLVFVIPRADVYLVAPLSVLGH